MEREIISSPSVTAKVNDVDPNAGSPTCWPVSSSILSNSPTKLLPWNLTFGQTTGHLRLLIMIVSITQPAVALWRWCMRSPANRVENDISRISPSEALSRSRGHCRTSTRNREQQDARLCLDRDNLTARVTLEDGEARVARPARPPGTAHPPPIRHRGWPGNGDDRSAWRVHPRAL